MTEDAIPSVNIFGFTNYRSYIEALANRWKADGRSMQALSRSLGFKSPNFVQQLVSGKRNLTENSALNLAKIIRMNDLERKYLLALVRLSKAKNPEQSRQILTVLKRLIGRSQKRTVLDTTIFDHWLYGVVFETFKLDRFATRQHLAAGELRVGVTSAQLDQALRFLMDRGYLVRIQNRLLPASVEFQPENDVRRINSQKNHSMFFTLAQHRLHDDLKEREFQGLTFAFKESRFPELKEKIRSFIKMVNDEFAEDHGGDQVVRLQLGCFKLLKPEDGS